MRVGVTGPSGFIGTHVVSTLAQQGHDVVAIRRNAASHPIEQHPSIEQVDVDLAMAHPSVIASLELEGCIHLGWHAVPPTYLHDHAQNLASLRASVGLVEGLLASDCRRFVFAGTCLEAAPVGTMYGEAKNTVHRMLTQVNDLMPSVCVHIYNVYGPGEHERRLIPTIIRRISEGARVDALPGDLVRHYVYVADVAHALACVLESDVTRSVDLCLARPPTMDEIYDVIERLMHATGAIERGAVRPEYELVHPGDPGPLRETGWVPRVPLERGLEETVRWWNRHG